MTPDQKANLERVREHLERHWLIGLTVAHVLTLSFDNEASKAALNGFAEHVKRQNRGVPIMVRSEAVGTTEITIIEEQSGVYIVIMGEAVHESFDEQYRKMMASLN